MKIARRIALVGASAGLAFATLATPASAFDFASISSINKELSTTYDFIACDLLKAGLVNADVLEDGMYNRELAEAIAARGEGGITEQYPQVGEWNKEQAGALADRAQKCGHVKEDTYLSELSSNLSS